MRMDIENVKHNSNQRYERVKQRRQQQQPPQQQPHHIIIIVRVLQCHVYGETTIRHNTNEFALFALSLSFYLSCLNAWPCYLIESCTLIFVVVAVAPMWIKCVNVQANKWWTWVRMIFIHALDFSCLMLSIRFLLHLLFDGHHHHSLQRNRVFESTIINNSFSFHILHGWPHTHIQIRKSVSTFTTPQIVYRNEIY